MTDPGRFASCIDRDPVYGCWLWTRGLDRDGYGISYNGGGPRQAHREVYRELVGEPPAGKLLDHLCRRRNCVRPDHLEPVTERENQLRRTWASRVRKATCRNGHSLADCITTADGGRLCRTCQGPEIEGSREVLGRFIPFGHGDRLTGMCPTATTPAFEAGDAGSTPAARTDDGGSSNGKTPGSEPGNGGSSPSPPTPLFAKWKP